MVPLADGYERKIRYIRVSITDRCNLRCRYCMPAGGVQWVSHDSIMRYEEFLRIIKAFAVRGVEKIRITGGEPLVRKGILGFIEEVKTIDSIKDLSLTTNGLLLKDFARQLIDAGINRINISLDTLDRDKFTYITRVDALDKVMAGIESALAEGFDPVKINVVGIRGFNDDEISSFVKLTIDTPLEVRFIELMPIGCANKFGFSKIMKSSEIKEAIEKTFGNMELLESGLGPAQVFRLPGAKGKVGFIASLSDHTFCTRCNRIRIMANGFLRPCLFSEYQLNLLTPMRQGITDEALGDLIEQGVTNKPRSRSICSKDAELSSLMNKIGG